MVKAWAVSRPVQPRPPGRKRWGSVAAASSGCKTLGPPPSAIPSHEAVLEAPPALAGPCCPLPFGGARWGWSEAASSGLWLLPHPLQRAWWSQEEGQVGLADGGLGGGAARADGPTVRTDGGPGRGPGLAHLLQAPGRAFLIHLGLNWVEAEGWLLPRPAHVLLGPLSVPRAQGWVSLS